MELLLVYDMGSGFYIDINVMFILILEFKIGENSGNWLLYVLKVIVNVVLSYESDKLSGVLIVYYWGE